MPPCLARLLPGAVVTLALTLAPAFAATPPRAGDLYIVCVGVDGHYPASAYDVNGHDALYVRQALVSAESLYRQTHSRVLPGTAATRPAVYDALQWLAASARPEDVAIVFFACHGNVEGKGHFLSLARAGDSADDRDGIWGHELHAALAKVKGQVILLVDSCHAGALVPASPAARGPAMIVSCEANGLSTGQAEHPDRPSGYFVIALWEALSGLADADHDRIVTLKEVGDYLPTRAQEFYHGQNAILLRRPEAEALPLARVNSAFSPQQLLTPTRPRNPFGWPDVPNPDGRDVHVFAERAKLDGAPTDPNARPWPRSSVSATDGLDGLWASRWSKHEKPDRWVTGTAQVRTVGDRVYIWFESERGTKHLVDTVRLGADRLAGRYVDPLRPGDSTPWTGRIVDLQRIDGQWAEGRWDLRRRFEEPPKPAAQQ